MAPVSARLRQISTLRRWAVLGVAAFLGAMPFTTRANTAGRAETLEAIHRVENPRDSTKPGRYGELGAYQFRRGTWKMHTKVPFERALDRVESEEVALRHYEWLRRGLERLRAGQSVILDVQLAHP